MGGRNHPRLMKYCKQHGAAGTARRAHTYGGTLRSLDRNEVLLLFSYSFFFAGSPSPLLPSSCVKVCVEMRQKLPKEQQKKKKTWNQTPRVECSKTPRCKSTTSSPNASRHRSANVRARLRKPCTSPNGTLSNSPSLRTVSANALSCHVFGQQAASNAQGHGEQDRGGAGGITKRVLTLSTSRAMPPPRWFARSTSSSASLVRAIFASSIVVLPFTRGSSAAVHAVASSSLTFVLGVSTEAGGAASASAASSLEDLRCDDGGRGGSMVR